MGVALIVRIPVCMTSIVVKLLVLVAAITLNMIDIEGMKNRRLLKKDAKLV